MSFLRMNELDLTNKRVLIREDLNVPLAGGEVSNCLLYTSPSPRDATLSRMPSSA